MHPRRLSCTIGRRTVTGPLLGGIAETQEVLDFCAEHGISADVEAIPMATLADAKQ